EILVSLNPERHQPTARWTKTLRETLPREFPGVTFFFQPADIVSQILNFGLPAPIDVQVTGYNQQATHEIALEVAARMGRIPGAVDVHLHQVVNTPSLQVNVDRSRAAELGLTQRDVANSMLVSLSSSAVVSPNYWSDPRSGINYIAAVQKIVAEYRGKLPPGHRIAVRGQVESMNSAFFRLGLGLIFAVLLVYLLMVVNFQSWLDPFIIMTALPAGFAGIVWMLFVTH